MADNYQWLLWLAGGVGLAAVEAATADFTFLMFAGGALAGSVAALFGASFPIAAMVAVAVGLGLLVFVRPLLKRHFQPSRSNDIGASGLIGRSAHVLQPVTSRGGQVKLAGEVWSARSGDEREYAVGAEVRVVFVDGATAVVSAAPRVTGPADPPLPLR